MRQSKIKSLIVMLVLVVTLILAIFSLTGCGTDTIVNVNVENSEGLNNTVLGRNALVKIAEGIYYDSTTRIVYWWNGHYYYEYGVVDICPYYAPNGLPYRYNPETNTFEEINMFENMEEE